MLAADGTRYRAGRRKGYANAPCRHCGQHKANRSRGLCWRCYHNPIVRDLYEPENRFRSRGGDFYGGNDLPPHATTAAPGTEDKIIALAARCAAKVSLWHPGDNQVALS